MRLLVFDLDHTLLTTNSSFRFGLYLYQKGFFSFFTLVRCLTYFFRHKCFGMSLAKLHTYSFKRLFKNKDAGEIKGHLHQFLNSLSAILNHQIIELLKEGIKKGDRVLLLSSSPDFIVGEIANRLMINRWKSSEYLVNPEGKFQKVSFVMAGLEKAQYVQELALELKIPLSDITVYSDSILDLPLLEIVGEPIGVSPDRQLKRICQKNGWEILSSRSLKIQTK